MNDKKTALLYGILAGLFSVLYLREIVQAAIVFFVMKSNMKFTFEGYYFSLSYDWSSVTNEYLKYLLLASYFISVVIIIELTSLIIKLKGNFRLKAGAAIFQLLNVSWLFFSMIFFIVSFIFKLTISHEWTMFFNSTKYNRQEQTIVIFFIALVLFVYISLVFNRITNYFTNNT